MEDNKNPALKNGKICYIEIPAKDPNQSATFYKKVFGWKSRTRGDGNLAFDDTSGEVSGAWVTGRKSLSEVGTLVYIWCENIEISIKAVIANGGTIVQPLGMDAPEKTARFTDPAGNIFGLYQEPG